MKNITPILILLSALLAGPLQAALTHDPSLHWKTLTSTHFEIHFHHGEEALAHEVAAIAERTHERLTRSLNWRPAQRTQMILTDRFDFSNGSATPFPRNTMTIIVTPPRSDSVLNNYNDWLDTLITHEYTHILHLDKRAGLPAGLQRVFGRLLPLFRCSPTCCSHRGSSRASPPGMKPTTSTISAAARAASSAC